MTCPACEKSKKGACGCGSKLPPVIQINNEECPILFHTVELETSYEADPPYIGRYKNVLCVYKADDSWVLYNSDGIYSVFGANVVFDAIIGRPKYAGVEMTSGTDIPDVTLAVADEAELRTNADNALSGRISDLERDLPLETTARENADIALGGRIDTLDGYAAKNVVTGVALGNNTSTVDLDITSSAINSSTPTVSTVSMPVASSAQAGVINSATFDAISQNTQDISAMKNGSVAVTGISASATQSDITTAWQNATGLTTVINGARVYDVDNNKVWTYYTNDTTWHEASNTTQVTVNTFTNGTEGIIKGSATGDGKIFAENDGTGSVNGWDTLSGAVSTATSKLSGIEAGAQVNVQADWAEADNTADDYIKNKPTTVSSFTNDANYVKVIASTTDIGENADLADDTLYVVYS